MVYTYDASAGVSRVYIDNVEVAGQPIGGDLSNWDDNYEFILANELIGERPWLGRLYLVAVYNQALSTAEVDQNFQAGPNGDGAPVADFLADVTIGRVPLTISFRIQN